MRTRLIALLCLCSAATAEAITVNFRLLDTATGSTTPAMVCITGTSDPQGTFRVPPSGVATTQPSRRETFVRGIRFEADRNWIGPIRKTMGPGDEFERVSVYELRPSLPYWTQPVMYQTSGDFTIDLPAGHWRIAVEHGMEYIPIVEEFTLTGTEGAMTKTIELKRWTNLPARGWWTGDVHVHHPVLEPAHREFLLHYATAEDLHVVNILQMGDEHGIRYYQMGFGKEYRSRRGDYCLVSGQEEPRSTFGHIIGLNIQSFVRDTGHYDFYDLAFRKLHEQPGAIVGFAHFAWNGCNIKRGFPWYVTTGDVDFVEILQFSKLNAMDYYDYLNLGFHLTAAAGSDTPYGTTIGEVRTVVHTGPRLDVDAWFSGLKAGHTFVSNGPVLEFTVDGQLPGSEIRKPAGSTVKVVARVWGHPKIGLPKALNVVGNEGVIREVANERGASELSFELELPIAESQWLVASAVCDNGAVAHSSPVYVVVNGRPTWSVRRAPAVIARQLAAMRKIEKEFAADEDERSRGVRERLSHARDYYQQLRTRIAESATATAPS